MAINPYFNNFHSSQEQELISKLIKESIQIYGMNMYYIPRTLVNRDKIFNEDDMSEYNSAYITEVYIKDYYGFGGNGDILSRFDIEIGDTIVLQISREAFTENITDRDKTIHRPREGDLIYFPLNHKIFKISFVEHEPIFYQMGSLQLWEIKCNLITYSNERFNTGITYLDNLVHKINVSDDSVAIRTEDSSFLVDETGHSILGEPYDIEERHPLSMNKEFDDMSNEILDLDEHNPFIEGS